MTVSRARKRGMVAAAVVTASIVAALLGWWAIEVKMAAAVHPARIGMSQVLARLALPPPDQGVPMTAPQSEALARDSVELCGLGRYSRQDLEPGSVAQERLGQLGEDALRRTVERLQAQPDERSRAVAHLILGSTASPMGISASASRSARDSLARLAVGASDAWVYALAHHVCARRPAGDSEGACQLISGGRWAQLEPDNAVPWLHVASEARQLKDEPGVEEAVYRASQARRNDARFGQSVLVAQAQMPPDLAPVVGLGIDTGLVGVDSAFALSGYQVVTEHCAPKSLGDPNRHAVCEGLATMLVERGSTLLDLSIGLGIGRQLEWPAERLAATEELRQAIYGSQADLVALESNALSPLGCGAVEAQRERLRQVAAQGEVAAYRSIADASPLGRSGLAAQHREAMLRTQRQFKAEEAAKEAASAPAN